MEQPTRVRNAIGTEVLRVVLLVVGMVTGVATVFGVVTVRDSGGGPALAVGVLGGGLLLTLGLLVAAAVLQLLSVQIRQARLAQGTFEQMRTGVLLLEQTLRAGPGTVAAVPAASTASIPQNTADAAAAAVAAVAAGVVAPRETGGNSTMPSRHGGMHGTDGADAMEGLQDLAPVLDLLQQLRDLTMMNEQQRHEVARRHWEHRRDAFTKLIDREMDMAEWGAASQHLAEIRTLLPEDAGLADLAARLQAEQASRLQQDLDGARVQLRHLMSITAWVQAEEVVYGLLRRYPQVPEARELGAELQREREAFERENFQRLMVELKEATDRKQWRRALVTADELIRRYPGDAKVSKLRADLPTLKEYAETSERREEEVLFRDLVHRQRYEEALVVAKRVMEKYPASSAAVEFGKVLPKVEELSRQEKSKRQAAAVE